VSDAASTLDDKTMAFGLLMESAQVHQKLAESQLQKLRDHTRDLDGVVRDEIRRTLVDELQTLTQETARTIRALEKMRRGVTIRNTLASAGAAVACAIAPIIVAKLALPTPAEIASLAARRDELKQNISNLKQHGGEADLKRCGASMRLCVQVDIKAPRYGDKADYFVIAGY
jgi:cell division protein FtsB